MARAALFTDRTILALKTDSYYLDVFDRSVPGFGLRVSKAKTKRFFVLYRKPDGGPAAARKKRRLPLGIYGTGHGKVSLAAARQAAREALAAVGEGRDPNPEITARGGRVQVEGRLREFLPHGYSPGTFGELAATYLVHHAWDPNEKKTSRFEESNIHQLLPEWCDRTLDSLTFHVVQDYVDQRRKSAPVGANRIRAMLACMWNVGIRRGVATSNPVQAIKRTREVSRSRYLSINELQAFLANVGEETPADRMLRMILFTAQRPGEVMGLPWEEIDGEWWTLPKERAKNGLETRIYLNESVRALLGPKGSGPVFPGTLNSQRNVVSRAIRKLGFTPKFTAHDLRRTARTHLARLGVDGDVCEAILNHVKGGMEGVHNLYKYDKEKEQAMNLWAGELQRLSGTPAQR
jgi:integrase